LKRYKLIVKYKTAFYTFYLPVAIGMIISGTTDKESLDIAQSICCMMGEYFQIQDDVLDCYGEPAMIGKSRSRFVHAFNFYRCHLKSNFFFKVGTDIQDNKCSWLVVQALSRVNAGQRKVLEENYGQWDDRKVAKIKALYKDLKLKELFEQYEEDSYQNIQKALDQSLVPRDVFDVLLKKIYKRSY
jgi:farnesyl diphosphate synthase